MPELPEVEIVKQSLNKNVKSKRIEKVIVRNRNLRFKVPLNFKRFLKNQKIIKVDTDDANALAKKVLIEEHKHYPEIIKKVLFG